MNAPTKRALVIDDEPVVLKSYSRILRGGGMEVECAASGGYGLELAAKNRFDVMLLDLKIPDVDGMEILRQVKQVRPGAVVVMVTGYPSVDTAVEAMKLGACDYVVKPFSPKELREVVARALGPQKRQKQPRGDYFGVHAYLARKTLEQQEQLRRETVPRAALAMPSRPARPRSQGRSLRTVNRQGKRIAIVGTDGAFGPGSELFSNLVEALKKTSAPVTAEYGYRGVQGKEILHYLEDNDKVVVLTQAGPGVRAGEVVKFPSNGASGRTEKARFDLPPLTSPEAFKWADAMGTESDLVVIGVGPHRQRTVSQCLTACNKG